MSTLKAPPIDASTATNIDDTVVIVCNGIAIITVSSIAIDASKDDSSKSNQRIVFDAPKSNQIVTVMSKDSSSINVYYFKSSDKTSKTSNLMVTSGRESYVIAVPTGYYSIDGLPWKLNPNEVSISSPALQRPLFTGGQGGAPYDTGDLIFIKAIRVRYNEEIAVLGVTNSEGNSIDYGGEGGMAKGMSNMEIFNVPKGEKIVTIKGKSNQYVNAIQFITDKNTISPFYGSNNSGSSFTFNAPPGYYLVGINGHVGNIIDSFGPIWGTSPTIIPKIIGGSDGISFNSGKSATILTSITISTDKNKFIESIELNGLPLQGGGSGHFNQLTNKSIVFNIPIGEKIITMIGKSSISINSIQFITDKGTASPHIGNLDGTTFSFFAPPKFYLVGIVGRADTIINAIAPIWGTDYF